MIRILLMISDQDWVAVFLGLDGNCLQVRHGR
jgi:hypothetical protein